MVPKYTKRGMSLQERIKTCSIPNANGCWIWAKSKRGVSTHQYGLLQVEGRSQKAHRIAYQAFKGPIPSGSGYHGTCVLHACDNTLCVNPDHLRLGSHADNMRDAANKGRVGGHSMPGSRHPMSKLTEAQVLRMRKMFADGHKGAWIAKKFHVSPMAVSGIVNNKRWRHI